MKSRFSILVILFLVLISCRENSNSQFPKINNKFIINNISPPKWIQGTWENYYESNFHKIVILNFSKRDFTIQNEKLLNNMTINNWIKCLDFQKDSSYSIIYKEKSTTLKFNFFLKNNYLNKEKSLIYTIISNGKLIKKQRIEKIYK
jgi:hypothetical protein